MAQNQKRDIYDALNDDTIDDFFNFRETRPSSASGTSQLSKASKLVPKIKKVKIKTPRTVSGTDYVPTIQQCCGK